MRLIHTITCNGALVYSDELLTRSRSYRRVKKQPIALLYKKALADEEEELNEDSQSVVVTGNVRREVPRLPNFFLLSFGEDETTLTRRADI